MWWMSILQTISSILSYDLIIIKKLVLFVSESSKIIWTKIKRNVFLVTGKKKICFRSNITTHYYNVHTSVTDMGNILTVLVDHNIRVGLGDFFLCRNWFTVYYGYRSLPICSPNLRKGNIDWRFILSLHHNISCIWL